VEAKEKVCDKCKESKIEALGFQKYSYKKEDGSKSYRSICRDCRNSNWKYSIMRGMISRGSANRKRPTGENKKNLNRDRKINGAFLEELKNSQKGKCYWLGIDLDLTMKDNLRKPSLDRLDNSKGYEADNVVLTTLFANTGRRDSTVSQMKSFLKNYLYKKK
jgi:hypothetical protein|tara:strand:- start:42 stop:527 length:486 start_codon:yes stop_codon:yes gene_type:complete